MVLLIDQPLKLVLHQPLKGEPSKEEPKEVWVMHVDGSSSSIGSGVGLILIGSGETIMEYALCFEFLTTNNEAECKTLIVRLRIVKELGI